MCSVTICRIWRSTLTVQEEALVQRQFRYFSMPLPPSLSLSHVLDILRAVFVCLAGWQWVGQMFMFTWSCNTFYWLKIDDYSLILSKFVIFARDFYGTANLALFLGKTAWEQGHCWPGWHFSPYSRFTTSCWKGWLFATPWISSTETWSHKTSSSTKYDLQIEFQYNKIDFRECLVQLSHLV